MSYNELKQHGSADFPIGYYAIDHTHPKYEMVHHWHPEHELIRVTKGTLSMSLNNRAVTVQAGDIVYVNGEVVHGATPDDCAYECIVFPPQFFSMPGCDFYDGLSENTIYIDDFFPHTDPLNQTMWDIIGGAFDGFAAESAASDAAGSAAYRYEVIGCMYRMFGWICSNKRFCNTISMTPMSARDEKNVRKLKHVLSFIRSAFDRPITLEEMASAAGVTPQYFSSFFKTMTGKTPFAYICSYRIERACRKLLGTDLSVTEIAYSCGFNDLSYFIKSFKAEKGMTPSAFRKRRE